MDARSSQFIADFSSLRQSGSVGDYINKFIELRFRMLLINDRGTTFTDEYFLAAFITGLSEAIRSFLELFDPQNLQHAFDLARKIEVAIDAIANKIAHPPTNLLTLGEIQSRIDKGLCYSCDEKLTPSHRCKIINRQSFMLMTKKEEEEEEEEIAIGKSSTVGITDYTTSPVMKFRGYLGTKEIRIVFGSGSAHSFFDKETAMKLLLGGGNCPSTESPASSSSQSLMQDHRSTDELITWIMEDQVFKHSMRLIMKLVDHEGCHMILGSDWLRQKSPVEFDYVARRIILKNRGHKIQFRAIRREA